jgi:hypothetical protein
MADEPQTGAAPIFKPVGDFPSPDTPVIYIDGVTNFIPGGPGIGGIAKLHLARIDAHVAGGNRYETHVFAQLAMPMASLIQTAEFLTKAIDNLVIAGLLSKEEVDKIREAAGAQQHAG